MKKRKLIVKQKVLVCIYSVLVLTLLVSCKKVIFNGSDDPLPTTPATKAPTAAPAKNPEEGREPEQLPTKEPAQKATSAPTPTEVPAADVLPTATPTPVPPTSTPTPLPTATPTPGPIAVTEAQALLLGEIGAGYEAEYTGDVKTGGAAYYLFTVSDRAHTYTPQIAVNANSKEMFYFYSQDELVEFANFPPDNLESAGGDENDGQEEGFTAQDAVSLLHGLTAAELGLPAKLSEYTILVDEWTTMVYGLECYCVNAYAELENRKQLMGVYFVATDGSAAYRSDMGDFVLIY